MYPTQRTDPLNNGDAGLAKSLQARPLTRLKME